MSHRVVIVGGGFAGLNTARALAGARDVAVTLIDRRNYHLFQPLLYQVATGGLSPGDIATPLRSVLKKAENVAVRLGEVVDVDAADKHVVVRDAEGDARIPYDSLVIATGAKHSYFGKDDWEAVAPGLKSIEDATEIRGRVLYAFEAAEKERDPEKRAAWLTFVVVGGGPTGVELAGALGELARHTMKNEFRSIDPAEARVLLVEFADRVLTPYTPDLSEKAKRSLEQLGVTVLLGTRVVDVQDDHVVVAAKDGGERPLPTRTVLWGAGVEASPLGKLLAARAGAQVDRIGRVHVEGDCTIAAQKDIYVVGDLAHFAKTADGKPLPGVAPVAMQQGRYVARAIAAKAAGRTVEPFSYWDKGSMAVIGRNHGRHDARGPHPVRRLPRVVRVALRPRDVPRGLREPRARVDPVGEPLLHTQSRRPVDHDDPRDRGAPGAGPHGRSESRQRRCRPGVATATNVRDPLATQAAHRRAV
jgi:NADH:ubiquinone reductase (H+-translocating)